MTDRRYTILHLDDEPALGHLLRELLQDAGYDVHYEPSKAAGYDWVIDHRPDLIISDIHSAGMDGLQFLHWIKRNPETRRVPFMFLTAFTDLQTAIQSRRLGVDEFVTKPFEYHDLLAAIERALAASWSPVMYPPRPPVVEVIRSGDLELSSWHLIDGLCRSLPDAWRERIGYVGSSDAWASFFVAESGRELVACCVDRPMHVGTIGAERVLDHHRWMRDAGARYGLLMGFFEPDVLTRSFARRLGIEILGGGLTQKVLRRAGLSGECSDERLLDVLGVDLSLLEGGAAFGKFAERVEWELAQFAGKWFTVFTPVSASERTATRVLLKSAGSHGLLFAFHSEPDRTLRLGRAQIWLALAGLWDQGCVDRRLLDRRPEYASCLFEVLAHVPSIDREDDLLRLRDAPGDRTAPKRQTVAVLDDNPEDRGWMCEFLRSAGYIVIGFEKKTDCLDLLQSPGAVLPNLMITDLHSPDLSGEEFIRIVRSDTRLDAIPVMVVSRHPYSPEVLSGLRHLKVTAFLRKPCEPGGLLQAVGESVLPEHS